MITREQYLNKAVAEVSKLFAKQGYIVPPVKISCSWVGSGNAAKALGSCWTKAASGAKINEINISPTIEKPIRILDVLAHELIHAIDNCKHGHRKEFTKIMRAIGLEGKPTATIASPRLHAELIKIVNKIGKYPHKKVTPNPPKQKSRQLKASCKNCKAIWRMASVWLIQAKVCPCCKSSKILIS